jgi:hypothetical protein
MFGNQVTTGLIEQYLDRHGWRFHQSVGEASEQQGMVMTGWMGADGNAHTMLIDPIVEKRCLSFRVPHVASAPMDSTAADRLSGLLMLMTYVNYQLILGGWAYDPHDGEVAFTLGIPIDDGKLSFDAFEHCVRVAVVSVEATADTLRSLIDGRRPPAEVLREAMAQAG